MRTVTHLETVRAEVRVAWPPSVACPPPLVRWRAGSDPTSWHTLLELARVRSTHPHEPLVIQLTLDVARQLLAQHLAEPERRLARCLVEQTLVLVGGVEPRRGGVLSVLEADALASRQAG